MTLHVMFLCVADVLLSREVVVGRVSALVTFVTKADSLDLRSWAIVHVAHD